jgi:hypothetical protein
METIFTIKDGQITAKNKMRKFFEEHEPGTYLLVSKPIKRRSLSQNNYFHGPVLDYVLNGLQGMGFNEVRTPEDAKNVVKGLFLKKKFVNQETGEVIEYIQETHKLTKSEMMEFIENIQRWAAEYLNISIPSPNVQLSAF